MVRMVYAHLKNTDSSILEGLETLEPCNNFVPLFGNQQGKPGSKHC